MSLGHSHFGHADKIGSRIRMPLSRAHGKSAPWFRLLLLTSALLAGARVTSFVALVLAWTDDRKPNLDARSVSAPAVAPELAFVETMQRELDKTRDLLERYRQGYPSNAADTARYFARAYFMLAGSGFLHNDGVDHLRGLWQRLDPDWKLLQEVTAEINKIYAESRVTFENTLGFRWLARVICWEFGADEKDVRHALDYIEPPEERIVRLPGRIDVGEWMARLLPLGDGGTTRGRIHFVVLANRLWRQNGGGFAELFQPKFWADVGAYSVHAFTLYHSLLVCQCAPPIVAFCIARHLILKARHHAHGVFRGDYETVFYIFGALWFINALSAYRDVMLPRVAMLTVNFHRRLVEHGYLFEADYSKFN